MISKKSKIVVTGGSGFVGSAVVKELKKRGYINIIVPRSTQFDLRKKESCYELLKDCDIVIHLAANVGGIGYNRNFPASIYFDNLMMGICLLEAAHKQKVKKFVAIGTVCGYPKYTPVPFREENFWDGYPEETNAPYGLSKKILLVGLDAYRDQYNFKGIYLIPVNIYGPGDNFNPNQSHVIPALIRKFYSAKLNKQKTVTVWGSGSASREFLYVNDVAKGIVQATEKYEGKQPVNLGSGREIKIKELAEKIAHIIEYTGIIIWDETKPDGQPRRVLNTDKARQNFGFQAETSFDEGLKYTINWYLKSYVSKKL